MTAHAASSLARSFTWATSTLCNGPAILPGAEAKNWLVTSAPKVAASTQRYAATDVGAAIPRNFGMAFFMGIMIFFMKKLA